MPKLKSKASVITFLLEDEIIAQIDQEASDRNLGRSDIIRESIREYIQKRERETQKT